MTNEKELAEEFKNYFFLSILNNTICRATEKMVRNIELRDLVHYSNVTSVPSRFGVNNMNYKFNYKSPGENNELVEL